LFMTLVSRLTTLAVVLSMSTFSTARAGAPDACKFLTTAAVAAALGKPVTGGTISVVDHAGASASSCTYLAGAIMVLLTVDERGTPAEAAKEFNTQLDNSRSRDQDEQKTVMEAGIGDRAFSDDMANGSVRGITALHGSRLFTLGIVNAGPVPHERVRSLMQTALRD
jgi:hypothetical protein